MYVDGVGVLLDEEGEVGAEMRFEDGFGGSGSAAYARWERLWATPNV